MYVYFKPPTFNIASTIPMTVCVLPVPGRPDTKRTRGVMKASLTIDTALLMASDCWGL